MQPKSVGPIRVSIEVVVKGYCVLIESHCHYCETKTITKVALNVALIVDSNKTFLIRVTRHLFIYKKKLNELCRCGHTSEIESLN